MDNQLLMTIIRVPAILIALTVHELSHGLAAKKLGDNTAEVEGRLTLNPLAHLDFFGTLMLFFGPFGWAKPVPVNPMNFHDPKKGMALVAIAGPLSNIILAAITGLFLRLDLVAHNSLFSAFLYIFFIINIGLAVFNLLPVYPLDGSRILISFLNRNQFIKYMKSMTVIPKVFLLMIVLEWLFDVPILSFILNPIFSPIFKFAQLIFIVN